MVGPPFFRELAYVFVAAVLGGTAAWLARQPLILGYVLGGILISPFTPGPAVSDVRTFEIFAEIGVVLLMFSLGIDFSLRDLLRVRWVALLGGPLGMLTSIGMASTVGWLLGWPPLHGIVIGAVVSIASTMVAVRLLQERGELHSRHGRVMVGILLVEDLAVVVLTVLLPALGTLEVDRLVAIVTALGQASLILVPFAVLAAKVVPSVMTRIARTQSQELFLLVALAIGLGAAALTQAVGLSLALGAFLAGLLISNSDYAHETLARLLSLRDAFVALFFVTMGALIDPVTVVSNLPVLGVMIGLIVVGNLIVWTAVVWLFRYPPATAILVAVGLTQIGEFSFVLVQVARRAGHVGDDVYNATLAASLITILLNAVLVRYAPSSIGITRLSLRAPEAEAGPAAHVGGHVVICGFGRVGSAVGEALDTFGVRYTVIERDPDIIKDLGARAVPCVFGDAAHRDLLARAGSARAALVVVALPEIDRARLAVRAVRSLNADVPILARAHRPREAEQLKAVGATEVIQPEVEAGATMIRHALARLTLPKEAVLEYLGRFRDAVGDGRRGEASAEPSLPEVQEVLLPAGGIADQSLRDARIRERFGVTVVAVRRGTDDVVFNPSPETILRRGDRVRVFGLPHQIAAFVEAARLDH